MSQEGLVSSNHYVVRIYLLTLLPPFSVLPSLSPPLPFISSCSAVGAPAVLQHSTHRSPVFKHHTTVRCLFVFPLILSPCPRPFALCLICHITPDVSTGLSLKICPGQTESTLTFSFLRWFMCSVVAFDPHKSKV